MNKTQVTRKSKPTAPEGCLYIAFELSKESWKLGMSDGLRRRARIVQIAGGDLSRLHQEIVKAKRVFGLSEESAVSCCYEAGRDGFWLHRYLVAQGFSNVVIDPASIEVSRQHRRAKTDRLDAGKLLSCLIRYKTGEVRVWSVVHIPSKSDEDMRQLHRELSQLKKEKGQHSKRIQSLLFTVGIRIEVKRDFLTVLDLIRTPEGSPVPEYLKQRLVREHRRLNEVQDQIREVNREREALLAESTSASIQKVQTLESLCGVGRESSWLLTMEFFGWRTFANRKEVGAAAGLVGVPYNSGGSVKDQGISKAGNKRVRGLMVELAWMWLRYQPASRQTQWFEKRYAKGGSRMRKVGIVALARRLLIELWRFVETGVVPEGARFKTA